MRTWLLLQFWQKIFPHNLQWCLRRLNVKMFLQRLQFVTASSDSHLGICISGMRTTVGAGAPSVSGEAMNCVICWTKLELLGRLAEILLAMLVRRFLKEEVSSCTCLRRDTPPLPGWCICALLDDLFTKAREGSPALPGLRLAFASKSCCCWSERGDTMPPTFVEELALMSKGCEAGGLSTSTEATDCDRRTPGLRRGRCCAWCVESKRTAVLLEAGRGLEPAPLAEMAVEDDVGVVEEGLFGCSMLS
mmetsp:Transcript_7169/g.30541  ORF Transcript_7169/g.30541 Transcript_7169/m.30541 type:complete len:248 (-) Transcript_7169:140-883(-)